MTLHLLHRQPCYDACVLPVIPLAEETRLVIFNLVHLSVAKPPRRCPSGRMFLADCRFQSRRAVHFRAERGPFDFRALALIKTLLPFKHWPCLGNTGIAFICIIIQILAK